MQILNGELIFSEVNKNAKGGTELMAQRMLGLGKDVLQDFQIFLSRIRDYDPHNGKYKIYICHDLPEDPESQHLDNGGWNKFHRIVFVSYWQRQQYINRYKIPYSKTVVLQNAIEPIANHEKPTTTTNIIYHTTPHRGLNILVPVFQKLCETRHLHLDVYSSFDIYGWPERNEPYKKLFELIEKDPNMTYHGSKTNDEVREALKKAHIFAYPSVWPETSCLSLIEAMSANCVCVHSDLAALPETSAFWTIMYPYHEDIQKHATNFYIALDTALNAIESKKEQIDMRVNSGKLFIDSFYSWENRKNEWKYFLETLKKEPVELKNEPLFTYRTS